MYLYNNSKNFMMNLKLLNIPNLYSADYSKIVEQFKPEIVMEKFKKVFLS